LILFVQSQTMDALKRITFDPAVMGPGTALKAIT